MRAAHDDDWSKHQERAPRPLSDQLVLSATPPVQLWPSETSREDLERSRPHHRRHLQRHSARLSSHSHQVSRVRSRLLSPRQDGDPSSTASTSPATSPSGATSISSSMTFASSLNTISGTYPESETTSWTTTTSPSIPIAITTSGSVSTTSTLTSGTAYTSRFNSSTRSRQSSTATRPYTSFTFKPNGTSTAIPGTAKPWDPLISIILSLASIEATASGHLTLSANITTTLTLPSTTLTLVSPITVQPFPAPTAASSATSSNTPSTDSSAAGSATSSAPYPMYSSTATSSGLFTASTGPSNTGSGSTSPSGTSFRSSSSLTQTHFSNTITSLAGSTSHRFTTITSSATSSSTTGAAGTVPAPSANDHTTTPTVVGSVVGGVAGISVIVVVLFFFFRWWKRKHDRNTRDLIDERPSTPGTTSSFLPAAATGLLSRFSPGQHESTPSSVGAGQTRSFERLSGRKLPSQWSPGMEGPRGAFAPTAEPRSSGVAFQSTGMSSVHAYGRPSTGENPFLDPIPSYGTIGGGGSAFGAGAAATEGLSEERETLMPSPARTPVVMSPHARTSSLASPGGPEMRSSFPHSGTRFREDIT